jgi:hypothetical protein
MGKKKRIRTEQEQGEGREQIAQKYQRRGFDKSNGGSRVALSKHQKCGLRPQKCGKNVAFDTKNMAKNVARLKICSNN